MSLGNWEGETSYDPESEELPGRSILLDPRETGRDGFVATQDSKHSKPHPHGVRFFCTLEVRGLKW